MHLYILCDRAIRVCSMHVKYALDIPAVLGG